MCSTVFSLLQGVLGMVTLRGGTISALDNTSAMNVSSSSTEGSILSQHMDS